VAPPKYRSHTKLDGRRPPRTRATHTGRVVAIGSVAHPRRQAARDRNRQSIVDETRATLPQEEPERRRTPGRAVRYEETGASVAGREKMRGALGNCAIFRISRTAHRCAANPETQMTTEPLFPGAAGGGCANWRQLSGIEKRICA
jgi:hypothetical protein